ncbi:MAG: bactofilin family protein [Gemmatimonadales bacterium]
MPEERNRRWADGKDLSIIGQGMHVTGDLETAGVLKIEGRITGTIRASDQVLVAQGAVVEGDIITREAVIGGEVHGSITARERVEVQASSLVTGDITTARIAIHEGGKVNGEMRMESETAEPGTAQKKESPKKDAAPARPSERHLEAV